MKSVSDKKRSSRMRENKNIFWENLREFVSNRHTLKDLMKGILQTDRKWFNLKKRKDILEHQKASKHREGRNTGT